MKKSTAIVLMSIALCGWTADVIIGVNGRTKHQIVIPDGFADEIAKESVTRAAKLMQEIFAESSLKMEIVPESSVKADLNGIYLGGTKFAAANGVDVTKLEGWEHVHKAVGKNIIIAGNDRANQLKGDDAVARYVRQIPYMVTLHSTAEFLYRYAGARFLKPGKIGGEVIPKTMVRVPDNLNDKRKPFFREHDWNNRSGDIFNIANHAIGFQRIWSRWGHQHPFAVPKNKYGKSNPEYFVQLGEIRNPSSGHLCLSNKAVQELIYKHLLERLDEGYDIVELGHGDGYIPCGCKECYNMYGIKPTSTPGDGIRWYKDPAWGEKLWIMHRDMAERMMKDRPGKKVMISSYYTTAAPPRTFGEFPENTIIEMMTSTQKNFKEWEKIKVPGGYSVYLYSWGNFHTPGLTPLNTVGYFDKESRLFVEKNARISQMNGLPFQYGLEGPNIYVYLRLGVDPADKTAPELYNEYLEAAFREAETPMRRFFNRLQNAVALWMVNKEFILTHGRDTMQILSMIYTPGLMNALEEDLTRAEKTAQNQKVKERLLTVRGEFDYLKHIVNVLYAYHNYNLQSNDASFRYLLDSVEARNKHIDEFMARRGTSYNPSYLEHRHFQWCGTNQLNKAPFNWDVEKMRQEGTTGLKDKTMKAVPAKTVPKLDSPEWERVEAQKLDKVRGANEELRAETTFKILYDKENLYIRVSGTQEPERMNFKSRGRDAEIWLAESIVINISPKADKSQYYYFTYEPVANSYADAEHGFITDTFDPRYGWNDWNWNGEWRYKNKLDAKNGRWESMAIIPFKTIKAEAPKSGTVWNFNIGRVHFYGNTPKDCELSVWNSILNPSQVPGDGSFGELNF